MIKRLVLDAFGKFRGRSFPFSPVTVFYGPNEAGKTTLFDAIFDGVSSPKGNTEPAKRLRERYGTDRVARLEFDGEPLAVPAADFLNLFAVRSGSISFEIEKNSEWMNRVKAELFSGGLDPQAAARRLEEALKSRARDSLGAETAKLEADLEALAAGLAEARAEREACLAEEKKVGSREEERRRKAAETERLGREIEALRRELEQQSFIKRRKVLEGALSLLAERKSLLAEAERLGRFDVKTLDDLKARSGRARALSEEAKRAEAALEAGETERKRLLEDKAAAEAEKDRLEKAGLAAEMLKKGLADRDRLVERKTVVVRSRPLAAAAAASLAGGIVFFFALPADLAPLGLAGGAAAAAVFLLLFLTGRREVREDRGRLEAALEETRKHWLKETGEDLAGSGYEAVLVALGRAAERAEAARKSFETVRDRAAGQEKTLAGLAAGLRKARDAAEAAEAETRKVLDKAGAADREQYAAKLERKNHVAERLAALDASLRGSGMTGGDAEIEAAVDAELRGLKERIVSEAMNAAAIERTENSLREKERRLGTLRDAEREAAGDLGRHQGSLRERFRGLPEKIAGLEREEADKRRLLAGRKTKFRAMELARDLFASLSGDADAMLQDLSREIGETFSRITSAGREVEFPAFDSSSASVADSGGERRAEARLSAGTRDAFLLAARLVLARKSVPPGGRALVVLDEPFLTLDEERAGKALKLLEEFREAAGWQILLFTKDGTLVEAARKTFGSLLTVHELDGA